jgi:AraC-like DNA-binding protein
MIVRRIPHPALRPFVRVLWASSETSAACSPGEPAREIVLPTGAMHLVLRLSDTPLRLFERIEAARAHPVGTAIVGGARASFYVRDVSQAAQTVGAQLEPGTASLLLGVPADELAGRHTSLDALWGRSVDTMRAQLADTPSLEARVALFERLLLGRLPRLRGLHPAVAEGLSCLAQKADVAAAVESSGYSHRRFSSLFREAVGLAPKLYCRVQRFQHALSQASRTAQPSWSAVALAAGYSDQAHFNREFREFTGLTPNRYRSLSPTFSHHVRLPSDET